MHKASISFYVNEYKFKIFINKIFKNSNLENLIVLRLKKLITKNKYIKQLLANKEGNITIYFPSGSSIIDENIISDILRFYSTRNIVLKVKGGVQGSVPVKVKINTSLENGNYFVKKQLISGVNFSLNRPLRKFLFKKFISSFSKILTMSFNDIVRFLKSEKSVNFFLRYGNQNIKIDNIKICPNCGSKNYINLFHSEGNTILGFLPNSVSYYNLCRNCELVYLNKQVSRENLKVYYQAISYDRKYSCSEYLNIWNKINEYNTSHYSNYLHALSKSKNCKNILDLGSGDGKFVALARKKNQKSNIVALDWYMPKQLQLALKKRKIQTHLCPINISSLKKLKLKKFDLITMWEVIEHLKIDDLKKIFSFLKNILNDNGFLVISTPDFDDPHCKSLDFWSMAAGEHLSVFNYKSINNILNQEGFFIKNIEKESVTIKMPNAWYKYGSLTNSNMASQGSALMIEHILNNNKLLQEYKKYCRRKKIGSEIIIFAKKFI